MEAYKDLMKHVDLSYNEITNAGCSALAKFLTGKLQPHISFSQAALL
jgi:hypothetical protein